MLKTKLYLHCLVLLISVGCIWSELQCVYHKGTIIKYSLGETSTDEESSDENSLKIDLSDSNNTQLCPSVTKHCYAVWKEDPLNKTVLSIVSQGCWPTMQAECGQSECRANKKPTKTSNITKFCCCSENFCNANVTDGYVPYADEADDVQPALQFVEHANYNKEKIVIALSSICSVVTVIVLACLIVRVWSASRKPSPDSIHLMEAPLPATPTFDLDSLKIQEIVGVGHYGSVCRGSLHNHTVAVKVFNVQNKQYFVNERDIYSLPFMDHPCLPKFIGAEERVGGDGKTEYLLVLGYAPLGSLHGYLINNVIDWPTLCKMAQTITKGLAHLHTEIRKGDKIKMCIAHRDLTSRNILVKNDGSCMLCDFGFAIRVTGSKYYKNDEKQMAETNSLADVGTLRYMAPEVLEGAVNLRDCESSLKQIDVYALGLILWEIATRCSDLFQGMEVPPYKAPFEAEINAHPTIEQMQVLVVRNKARPLFPDIWKDTNPAVRSLKETIEDCWDQDAEARLTALCVEERLMELPHLWERHKAGMTVPGVSPTVNPTSNSHSPGIVHGISSSSSCSQVTGITSVSSERSFFPGETPNNMSTRNADRISSTSENTAETFLTLSPSDSLPTEQYNVVSTTNIKNNATTNLSNKCPRVTVPLQPHQGRNPCIERNLIMKPLEEEVSVSGNMLLDRELKFREQRQYRNFTDHVNDLYHTTDHNESNALVTNDVLNQSNRGCHPIPYVQNAVHLPNTMPKQPNLPGNGHQLSVSRTAEPKQKRWRPFGIFYKRKQNVVEGTGFKAGLRNFLGRKGKSENHQEKETQCSNNISMQRNTTSEHSPIIKELYLNKLHKSSEHVDTEICMVNGSQNSSTTPAVICRVMNSFSPDSLVSGTPTDEHHPLMKVSGREENLSNVVIHKDINGNCSNDIPKRPNSLPVKGYKIKQNEDCEYDAAMDREDCQIMRRGSSGRQKIVKRVKTPFEIKKGRFSLYDDRIMVSECVQVKPPEHLELNDASKISLSLPLDIDTLCASQADSFLQECHRPNGRQSKKPM